MDVDGAGGAPRLELQQARGLPCEQLVGQPLERLAEHDEAAGIGVARAEVEVREPALPAPVAPLGGEHDEVERVHRLDLEPAGARGGRPRRARRAPSRRRPRARARARRRRTPSPPPRSSVTMRGTQAPAGSTGSIAASRSLRRAGRGGRGRRGAARRRRTASAAPPARRAAASPRLAARLAVSWNGRGRPSGRSAMASPSRITERSGSARTASAISGMRSPTGSSVRVKIATSSPSRCTWMRTPSSFHSTAARPVWASAAASDGAVFASIGWTGRPTCELERREPGLALGRAPPRRRPARSPASIAARRTAGAGHACGRRDAVGDDAGERALAQLAARELRRGSAAPPPSRARTAPRAASRLAAGRAGPGERLDAREGVVHLGTSQARLGGRGGQSAQRRPADARAALAQLAREVARGDRDLAGRGEAQAVGERCDLGQARARRGDGAGCGDEVGEQHGGILASSGGLLRDELRAPPERRARPAAGCRCRAGASRSRPRPISETPTGSPLRPPSPAGSATTGDPVQSHVWVSEIRAMSLPAWS